MTLSSLVVSFKEEKKRSYPICIGSQLLSTDAGLLIADRLENNDTVIVTNEVVAPLYLERLTSALTRNGIEIRTQIVLPDGEKTKHWDFLNTIFDRLLKSRAERKTALIALGGGVIGDLVGFAAACYQRGVPYIQVPTSLLAQVDSSVGGKTAINHPDGKNMIGAFYQPHLVLADIDTLNTLPEREFRSGLAEVIKYGLIRDLAFFEWLENNLDPILHRDPECLQYMILRSCQNKAEVVSADEREAGERVLLNYGHTFGHAIETLTNYRGWLHGEAVAVGMVLAAELSRDLGWITQYDVDRVSMLLGRVALPGRAPALGADRYREAMLHDKKVSASRINFVLLESIGHAVAFNQIPEKLLRKVLERYC